MSSNRKLSIAIISILILSAFTTSPMTSAISDPYITVYPSSVSPGRTVYVKGYNFEPGNTVDIYCDEVDDYHHLGSAAVNWYGRFYFSFVMQEGYPGICTIIAVNPPDTYTADIELRYTNPLDQRLVDIINGLSAGVGDIGGTLDDIWSAVDTMEADLLSWMTTNLKTNIDKIWSLTGNTHGWSNLASALDDIKGEINDIWGKVDDLDSWFGSGGKYSKTEQIVAGKGSTTFTDQPYYHYIFTQADKTTKIAITIKTFGIGSGEKLGFIYDVGYLGMLETIADGTDIGPQTYEFCFTGYLALHGKANQGESFRVDYSYVVEYQP